MIGQMGMIAGKPRKKKMGITSILLGLTPMVVAFYIFSSTAEYKSIIGWKKTNAKVVNIDTQQNTDKKGRRYTTTYPVFQIFVDGIGYRNNGAYIIGQEYHIGETKEIVYNPKNPNNMREHSTTVLIISGGLFVLGLLGVAIIATSIIKQKNKEKAIKNARSSGDILNGEIVRLENTGVRINNVENINVVVGFEYQGQYMETKCVMTRITEANLHDYFKSPTPIPVYFDRRNPTKFYVEEESIIAVSNSALDFVKQMAMSQSEGSKDEVL